MGSNTEKYLNITLRKEVKSNNFCYRKGGKHQSISLFRRTNIIFIQIEI